VVEVPRPEPGPGELLVRVQACGVCGTDLLKLYTPTITKPVQLGHEVVGTVAAIGSGVHGWSIGQRLALAHHAPCYACHFCRHGAYSMCPTFKNSNIQPGGFSEYVRLPAPLVGQTALAIPDSIPDERAVFLEPLACCLRALKRVPALLPGDTVIVVGAGTIGVLFVALLQQRAVHTIALELRADRRAEVQAWGARGLDPTRLDLHPSVRAATHGRGADLVILTVANAATVAQAFALVRDGGTLLVFGAQPTDSLATLDLWDVYRRELVVLSSYSPSPADLHEALHLLCQPGFAFERLVTLQLPLERIAEGMARGMRQEVLKVVIRP
jgi:L-iditol 2-dehydrogenase